MESLYKKLLKFTFLTLFQLLVTATSDSVALTASKNCTEKCGNMNISYPFGIKDGCFRSGFQIICDETTGTASTIEGFPIIDISLSQAQMRVYNYMSYSCNHPKGGKNVSYTSYLGLSDESHYKISPKRNKFTAVGCQTLAYIVDPYVKFRYNISVINDPSLFATGCLSLCTNQSKSMNDSTCSGIGCCQTSIPEGLAYYNISFDSGFNNEAIWDYSPCSFAFVAEDGFYSFLQSDTENMNLYKRYNQQAPVVLDWVLGNETCKKAKLNKSGNYACVSLNSSCIDSEFGYTCNCNQGYEGNPYIDGGCTDVDECKNMTLMSQCYGNCINLQGSYTCTCPVGYEGYPRVLDGCRRIQKSINVNLVILIEGICVLCNHDEENIDHLFFACPYITYLRVRYRMKLGLNPSSHLLLEEAALELLQNFHTADQIRDIAFVGLVTIIYHIWTERNLRIHEGKNLNKIDIWRFIEMDVKFIVSKRKKTTKRRRKNLEIMDRWGINLLDAG